MAIAPPERASESSARQIGEIDGVVMNRQAHDIFIAAHRLDGGRRNRRSSASGARRGGIRKAVVLDALDNGFGNRKLPGRGLIGDVARRLR